MFDKSYETKNKTRVISDIDKFKNIYRKIYGTELTNEQASEKASKLLRMVELIYCPMTEKEFKLLQKRRRETKS